MSAVTRRRERAGFVLVLTLGALAIMTLLLLALLAGGAHQVRAAESDATTAREKMLADSAVALVIGQIQQASTQAGQTWISQPGLLRTYDATASRHPTACYKLYSSTTMTDTSGNLNFLASDVPADWNSTANENLYTDLNAPQQTPGPDGEAVYPILDPDAAANVEGVSIDSPHGVEMPVQWLYELQDGTLGPAANGTTANPIVGRIAFWTDDETCKINLNTAGAGSAWNTPRINSSDDQAWLTTAPAIGEFSRYPGHPAMTSLLPVFGLGTGALSPQQLLALTPRYAWGGSEFGAQATTVGEAVPPKTDRLYASVDELSFGTQTNGSERLAGVITPAQIEQARFVLTTHSEAPETTMLGEPRIAIWPVSDMPQDSTQTTAADRAVESAATVGARQYFFQRNNALSGTAELDPKTATGQSNTQLLDDLVARGGWSLPGYGASFGQKYAGAKWEQLMVEITDFIRSLNAVDPSPAPFVPYAVDDATGLGRGFIVPLTTTSGTGTGTVTLRGLGRCPTLSGLTLVFYVCGFGFDSSAHLPPIDYETAPDTGGGDWEAHFQPSSPLWQHVNSELVRAFVVPCTFQPGCAYPEVSDKCDIQIQGLNGLGMTSPLSNDFGFAPMANSPILGNPLKKLSPDRAWGGNEGPITWRAVGDAMLTGEATPYPFAGTQAFSVPLSAPTYIAATKQFIWPPPPQLKIPQTSLTVLIRDSTGATLQTLHVTLPAATIPAPTPLQEYSLADGGGAVEPSYYMTLKNRLLATQETRPFLIQPGDSTRTIEPRTDWRVIAGLSDVPASFFTAPPTYTNYVAQVHNLNFADGTAVYGSTGATSPVSTANYNSTTTTVTGTDWTTGTSIAYLLPPTAPRSTPRDTTGVTMDPTLHVNGDWDTGLGFAPDGALIGLPDAGTTVTPQTAYFSLTGGQVGAATRFSPNALVPSPVIFGSLPAGIDPQSPGSSEPWRTLLFCPYPAADTAHPGFATPPDHLVLDNFWMPVVAPYALSTCMATAGKINLNDQIAPFTYLHRNTAFHALLHDLRIPAIPVSMASSYKSAGPPMTSIWKQVDENATILAWENRFAAGSVDAYLSESEICTQPLVPVGETVSDLDAFWNGVFGAGRLTGDNLRELPYAQLYSRLTTRSNSYTVHVRVQVLQKLPHDPQQNVWKEGTDLVLGDWRGSYEIERYLDPAAQAPVSGQTTPQPLGPYRYRIVSTRRFAP